MKKYKITKESVEHFGRTLWLFWALSVPIATFLTYLGIDILTDQGIISMSEKIMEKCPFCPKELEEDSEKLYWHIKLHKVKEEAIGQLVVYVSPNNFSCVHNWIKKCCDGVSVGHTGPCQWFCDQCGVYRNF